MHTALQSQHCFDLTLLMMPINIVKKEKLPKTLKKVSTKATHWIQSLATTDVTEPYA